MVKRTYGGLKVFRVDPQSGEITEVVVDHGYKAGKPYYEARLLVRTPTGSLWDIFAASAFRRRQDADRGSARVREADQ